MPSKHFVFRVRLMSPNINILPLGKQIFILFYFSFITVHKSMVNKEYLKVIHYFTIISSFEKKHCTKVFSQI